MCFVKHCWATYEYVFQTLQHDGGYVLFEINSGLPSEPSVSVHTKFWAVPLRRAAK